MIVGAVVNVSRPYTMVHHSILQSSQKLHSFVSTQQGECQDLNALASALDFSGRSGTLRDVTSSRR